MEQHGNIIKRLTAKIWNAHSKETIKSIFFFLVISQMISIMEIIKVLETTSVTSE